MKKNIFLFVITLLILSKTSYCDIIPFGRHAIIKCIKITNTEDYPENSFIGYDKGFYVSCELISSECLSAGYWTRKSCIFAVNKTYLIGNEINKIDWENDKNIVKSNTYLNLYHDVVDDSIPIYSLIQFYKILGFTDSSVVLFKWKEVEKDINGKVLSENEFTYDGDISKLAQKIPVGINSNQYSSTFTLFPNPAQQVVYLKASNFYVGKVPVEIYSFGGKLLKSITLNKTDFIHDFSIPIGKMPKGIYFVTVRFGAMTETRNLIID